MSVVTPPPINPSQVFFGDNYINGVRPKPIGRPLLCGIRNICGMHRQNECEAPVIRVRHVDCAAAVEQSTQSTRMRISTHKFRDAEGSVALAHCVTVAMCSKCRSLSVARISETMVDRHCSCKSDGISSQKSDSSSYSNLKQVAACIDSMGEESLYSMASGCRDAFKKALFTPAGAHPRHPTGGAQPRARNAPRCAMSWHAAATRSASADRLDRCPSSPPVFKNQKVVWTTSAACSALWYCRSL